MDAQLKKGLMELFLLKIISNNEIYGYLLVDELNKIFTDVSESAFYAILRRLVMNNYLEIYDVNETKGPKRKYYRLTDSGEDYLDQKLRDLSKILDGLRALGITL